MMGSPIELVRQGLYETIAQTENSLERFILDREDGLPLQEAIDGLQQIRGILDVIELASAQLLVQEMMRLAMGIPAGAGEDRNEQLASLGAGLHILRRHLESLDSRYTSAPELLLPAINNVRTSGGMTPLPESFFFSVPMDKSRPGALVKAVSPDAYKDLPRLRHMYQIGLLGVCRSEDIQASLQLMERALVRLQDSFESEPAVRLCWIAAAALESLREGKLISRTTRKMMLAQVDRQVRACIGNSAHEAPGGLLKDLLYLVALSDASGPRSVELRDVFKLPALPFSDHELEAEYARLAEPGQEVMRSLASAISEEVSGIKDLLDLIERGAADAEGLPELVTRVTRLAKTLEMVDLRSESESLMTRVHALMPDQETIMAPNAPADLAHALLAIEGQISRMERENISPSSLEAADALLSNQLVTARESVLSEALNGLARTRSAISTFMDTQGDQQYLAGVPETLQAVRGGFWFLGEQRAAELVSSCEDFIRTRMLEGQSLPAVRTMEALADALTSLEYFLESGSHGRQLRPRILDLASESVQTLYEEAAAA
jgi:hypothetical protein